MSKARDVSVGRGSGGPIRLFPAACDLARRSGSGVCALREKQVAESYDRDDARRGKEYDDSAQSNVPYRRSRCGRCRITAADDERERRRRAGVYAWRIDTSLCAGDGSAAGVFFVKRVFLGWRCGDGVWQRRFCRGAFALSWRIGTFCERIGNHQRKDALAREQHAVCWPPRLATTIEPSGAEPEASGRTEVTNGDLAASDHDLEVLPRHLRVVDRERAVRIAAYAVRAIVLEDELASASRSLDDENALPKQRWRFHCTER